MEVKTLIKNISMIVGIAAVAAVGLFFIIYVDLYLKGDSVELFIGIILPLASIVMFILAESFKHKPSTFFFLKILAYLLAIGFIVYAFLFMQTPTFVDKRTTLKLIKTYGDSKVFFLNATKFNDGIDIPFDKVPAYVVMLIVAIVGAVAQIINSIMNKVIGLD